MAKKNQHVTKRSDGLWQVKGEGNSRATRVVKTQDEAIAIAKKIAHNQGSKVHVHRPDGRVREIN